MEKVNTAQAKEIRQVFMELVDILEKIDSEDKLHHLVNSTSNKFIEMVAKHLPPDRAGVLLMLLPVQSYLQVTSREPRPHDPKIIATEMKVDILRRLKRFGIYL